MKKQMLLASAVSTAGAALIGSLAMFSNDPSIMAKVSMVALYTGLLGMGLFFVGLALPKE